MLIYLIAIYNNYIKYNKSHSDRHNLTMVVYASKYLSITING